MLSSSFSDGSYDHIAMIGAQTYRRQPLRDNGFEPGGRLAKSFRCRVVKSVVVYPVPNRPMQMMLIELKDGNAFWVLETSVEKVE